MIAYALALSAKKPMNIFLYPRGPQTGSMPLLLQTTFRIPFRAGFFHGRTVLEHAFIAFHVDVGHITKVFFNLFSGKMVDSTATAFGAGRLN